MMASMKGKPVRANFHALITSAFRSQGICRQCGLPCALKIRGILRFETFDQAIQLSTQRYLHFVEVWSGKTAQVEELSPQQLYNNKRKETNKVYQK
jgi:hypothetical protein